jgi:hypothetical protein
LLLLLSAVSAVILVALLLGFARRQGRKPIPGNFPKEAPDYSRMPRYGSKRWARMMYKNGYTTMEELVQWFAANPGAPED